MRFNNLMVPAVCRYVSAIISIALVAWVPAEEIGASWRSAQAASVLPGDNSGAGYYYDGKFWMFYYPDGIYSSEDAISWSLIAKPSEWGRASGVLGRDDELITMDNSGVWRSNAPYTQWTKILDGEASPIGDLIYPEYVDFNGRMCLIGGGWLGSGPDKSGVWSSDDGINWTEHTSTAPWGQRSGHSVAYFKSKLWLFGGLKRFSNEVFNDVWSSTDGAQWSLEAAHAPWTSNYYSKVAVFKGRLWIYGVSGSVPAWSTEDGVTWREENVNDPYALRGGRTSLVVGDSLYFLGNNYWAQNGSDVWRTSDGTNWDYISGGVQWSERSGQASVRFQGKIYLLGGEDFLGPQSDVWRSEDGRTWDRMTTAAPWAGRRGHSAVVHNDAIWVIGGADRSQVFSDVWRSTDGATWEKVSDAAAFGPRYYHGAASLGGKLWVAGGLAGGTNQLGSVWSSTDGLVWQEETALAPWGPRFSMGMVSHEGKLWIAGGENITNGEVALGDVWYSQDGVNWTSSGANIGIRGNPTLRSYAGRLWVAGGWQYYDSFHVTNHYANDLRSSADGITWTTDTAEAPWDGRRAHSMEFLGNRLLLFAGEHGQTAEQSSMLRDVWETSGDFPHQSADVDGDLRLSLSELLRLIQFYNGSSLHCASGSEDGFAPGAGDTTCTAHQSDYNPQDWKIDLSELLRAIQFYNAGGYTPCVGGEDGFCPGD